MKLREVKFPDDLMPQPTVVLVGPPDTMDAGPWGLFLIVSRLPLVYAHALTYVVAKMHGAERPPSMDEIERAVRQNTQMLGDDLVVIDMGDRHPTLVSARAAIASLGGKVSVNHIGPVEVQP